jgi:hypothetical protein
MPCQVVGCSARQRGAAAERSQCRQHGSEAHARQREDAARVRRELDQADDPQQPQESA